MDADSFSESDLLLLENPMDGAAKIIVGGANGTLDTRQDRGRTDGTHRSMSDDELLDITSERFGADRYESDRYETLGYMNADYDEEEDGKFQTSRWPFCTS